ncbi:MAG TPA: glycosyltransferase [Sphingobacterium sp.]|nr:glycosyltransferase [Sphingobacterium sp.]
MEEVLMCCFGKIKNDGRILRSIDGIKNYTKKLSVVSFDDNRPNKEIDIFYQFSPRFGRIRNFVYFVYFISKTIKKIKPSIVYLHDYYTCSLAFVVKIFSPSTKIIYDAHELLIDETRGGKKARTSFFSNLEKWTIKYVDKVIAANHDRASIMYEEYKLKNFPLVIRNIPERSQIQKVEIDTQIRVFISLARKKNKKIFVYQGAIVEGRGLEKYIRIFEQLHEKCVLIFVGDGPYFARLKNEAHGLVSKDVILFAGRLNLAELYSVLEKCDFGIISYVNSNWNNKYCAPNKLFEYASLCLPFITTNQSTILQEIADYSFALPVELNDSAGAIADKIEDYIGEYLFNEEEFERFNSVNNFQSERVAYKELFD